MPEMLKGRINNKVTVQIDMLPPKEVSPNYHGALKAKMRATKAWREAAYYCARQACPGDLRKHYASGIRRWYHKIVVRVGCFSEFHSEEDWPIVDQSLGETTHEEAMSIGNVMLHLEDNKN